MTDNMYWISTITYAFVLAAIYVSEAKKNKKPNELENGFRLMLGWVIFFCIQDTVWGMCAAGILKGDKVFFAASSLFHFSTVITTFFWLYYVLLYMGNQIRKRRVFLILDGIVILYELVLVVVNFYKPTLFLIEDGVYVTGPLRPFTFMNQYVIYFVIGVLTFVFAIKTKTGDEKKRYWSVFSFALAPILLGIFQLLYPEGPFYSLGYFLGCFIVHLFIVSKDREESSRMNVLKSIADTYYSMHLIDLESDQCEALIEPKMLTMLMENIPSAQQKLYKAFRETASDEYSEMVHEFVRLSSISARLKDTNLISFEFIGRNYGWTRVSFVSVEREGDIQKKVMVTTQIIDEEKKLQMNLLYQSHNDELTGLYNRRAFERDMEEFDKAPLNENIVFVSIDVNGLKNTNDSLGHDAGDELLKGAAVCMKKCLGVYGKVYRTGGDEFCAIIFADSKQLEILKRDLDEMAYEWKGERISSIALSCGYVSKTDSDCATLHDMSLLADKRMYEAKTQYYMRQGLDRRGQRDAHLALFSLYTKILKINITDDSYQIINMNEGEKTEGWGFADTISEWLANFGRQGGVHPDDLQMYLEKTDINYLREYFAGKKEPLTIFYRRLIDGEYKRVMFEIVPANDYSGDNQTLYLYVKNIDK